jgi:hypothetical protein
MYKEKAMPRACSQFFKIPFSELAAGGFTNMASLSGQLMKKPLAAKGDWEPFYLLHIFNEFLEFI